MLYGSLENVSYKCMVMTDTNNTILKNKRSPIEVLQCNKWEKNKEINLMKCKPIWALFFNSLKSHQHRRKFKAWHAKRQSRCDILQIWSSKKEKKSKKQLVITSLWERDILQIDVIFSGLSSDGSVKVKHDYL